MRTDWLPEGQIEKQSFRRYALVTVQIDDAQALELQAQYRWVNHPDHPIWFPQMERLIPPGVLQELRKLQQDRSSALNADGEEVTFFKVLTSALTA